MKRDLEEVLDKKLKPLISETTKKFMGVSIDELNRSLLDKIEKPSFNFEVRLDLNFKSSKRAFKKIFLSELIETRFGNISEVAKVADVDRRSIHRAIKDLGIEVKRLREGLLNMDHYESLALGKSFREALDEYKQIIHPDKLDKIYENVEELSKEVVKEIPDRHLTWKEAEKEWERIYIREKLKINNNNVTLTAKMIGLRYETLHRKIKSLGLV
jgi:DNA-binding NtrC family response regulator